MRYRRFGKTNLLFSVFSLGTMRCLADATAAKATIMEAISAGINHIETARGYGKSEEYLGLALQSDLPVSRNELYITTKIPPTFDAPEMRQWIVESLLRLKLEYIDCLVIHGINTREHLDWVKSDSGCMEAVREAMLDGKIRHVGFSTHGDLELITETINTGFFEFVNLHYYYFFQRHESAVELAYQKDLGIFIISPADKGGRLYHPSATLRELCQPFSPLALNYRFLLSDRRITTLSLGPEFPEQLKQPLELADSDYPLTTDEFAVLEKLEKHLYKSLATDNCTQCYQCLPCPENINIPEILRLRNLAVAYDMNEYGQYRYRMLENAGHWFPGNKGDHCTNCGDCLPRCPNNLDIPTLLFDTHDRLNGASRRRLWQ